VVAPFLGGLALASSIAGLLLVSLAALANRALPGPGWIAVGSLLNVAVISINGGMPIDPGALAASGKPAPADALHLISGPENPAGFHGRRSAGFR